MSARQIYAGLHAIDSSGEGSGTEGGDEMEPMQSNATSTSGGGNQSSDDLLNEESPPQRECGSNSLRRLVGLAPSSLDQQVHNLYMVWCHIC